MAFQVDVTVANKFISSLSKSLQALCHGCMDFDSGIEIVGYININIDSGSKVDYVLNEKVLKSTTNSMTFVSNSFLAKKEIPKQTRDGACSPVAELRSVTHRSSFHGPHVSMQFSQRGSHKRPWSDRDWRASPKRSRGGYSGHLPSSTSTSSNFTMPSQPQTQNLDPTHALLNVKQEFKDSTEHANTEATNQTTSDQLIDTVSDSTQILNIKKDPDMLTDPLQTATKDTIEGESPSISEGALHQKTESSLAAENVFDSNNDNLQPNESEQAAGVSNLEPGSSWLDRSVESNVGEPSVAFPSSSRGYDGAGEDSSYYQDPGEGSSDAGQFEVIEIGDEDEDVGKLFGVTENHHIHNQGAGLIFDQNRASVKSSPSSNTRPQPDKGYNTCTQCGMEFVYPTLFQSHMEKVHLKKMSFVCPICGKCYGSRRGLGHHKNTHEGHIFTCLLCSSTFSRKDSVKNHLKSIHNSIQCPACKQVFRMDTFEMHKMNCCNNQIVSEI